MKGHKIKMEIFKLLSLLFWNKNFISQESPIQFFALKKFIIPNVFSINVNSIMTAKMST